MSHPPSPPLNTYESHWRCALDESVKREPAGLPVSNPSQSFWLHPSSEVNPLAKEGSHGVLTEDAHVCIIGSGITGVTAAYHFAKSCGQSETTKSLKVVIIEARDFCSGATGRNGGHLTPAAFLDFRARQDVMGTEEALKQYALEHHSVDGILEILNSNNLVDEVDLVSGGHIDIFLTEKELTEAKLDFHLAKEAGAELDGVQWLSKHEMAEVYGTSHPAVRIPGYNLWPMKYVTQLYYIAQRIFSVNAPDSFLRLHTRTPVTAINPDESNRRRWSVRTHRGSISCNVVLHATNGYASHLLPFLAGPRGIIPTRGQVIASRASVPLSRLSKASWSGNEGFEYWFPRLTISTENPLVLLGGGREIEEGFELYKTDDSTISEHITKALQNFLPAVFPGKYESGSAVENEWTGIMGFTKLKDPFVGPVLNIPPGETCCNPFEGQYLSAGYTGHGMPRTYACAEAVVSLIIHDMSGGMRDSWVKPNWLPSRYLTWIRETADEFAQSD